MIIYMRFFKFVLLFFLFVFNQTAFSKPTPPGSGTGDVPANILILLDTSDSMNRSIASDYLLEKPEDIVVLSDGSIVVLNKKQFLMKIDPATDSRVTTFGDSAYGKFYGNHSFGCDGWPSSIHTSNHLAVSDNVKGLDGEIIFVAEYGQHNGKIVMLNSDGQCVKIINHKELGGGNTNFGFRPRAMEVKTINGEDHLFASGEFFRGVKKSYMYTENLTKGTSRKCNVLGSGYNIVKASHTLTVDDGNHIYFAKGGWIYKYEITKDASTETYCPGAFVVRYRPDCDNPSIGHCQPHQMQIDPSDPDIMYITTGNKHKVQRLSITDTALVADPLPGITRGQEGRSPTLNNDNVTFNETKGLYVDSTNVWVSDFKHSIQKFNKDSNMTWLANYGYAQRRIDGAIAAIKGLVSDSSFRSGANFGYGWWNSGSGEGLEKHDVLGGKHCHNNACDYYVGWEGDRVTGQSTLCNGNSCLKIGISQEGYGKIVEELNDTVLAWGTDAYAFAQLADEYYRDDTVKILSEEAKDCQTSYVIVISDGAWVHEGLAEPVIAKLRQDKTVKTLVVAYGDGIDDNTITNKFDPMALAGSCDTEGDDECEKTIIARTPEELKQKLQNKVQQIVAERLSFTAPSITATIQQGGSLYQAQFDFVSFGEWEGTILKKFVHPNGKVEHSADYVNPDTGEKNWDAAKLLKERSDSRNLWTALKNVPYVNNWNNFTEANSDEIKTLFEYTGNEINDYYNSSSKCTGEDTIEDDLIGLINFVRGIDYFNYRGDCTKIDQLRDHILGDVYHSQIIEVGAPSANINFSSPNQESYWRKRNNYQSFARLNADRKRIIYAGANDGMLHAFNALTGEEEWGFIPPFVAGNLPKIINSDLEGKHTYDGKGGTNAIFGVDGSPVVHDMYIKGLSEDGNLETSERWHTILMVPYGRGGAGFSVLDITNPDKPLHMFSIYNDADNFKVMHADKDGNIVDYEYLSHSYTIGQSQEARKADNNNRIAERADEAAGVTTNQDAIYQCQTNLDALSGEFLTDGTNACYEGNTFTFEFITPSTNVNDYEIIQTNTDGTKTKIDLAEVIDLGGRTRIKFSSNKIYDASTSNLSTAETTQFKIVLNYLASGAKQNDYKYDYSRLGETWSTPRIFRMPIDSGGTIKETYVAVMGGGMGVGGSGSNVFIINMEDSGSIVGSGENIGPIDIIDIETNGITNTIPNDPIVITPDTAPGIPWKGAMVYINDLEGKITKINLTNSKVNDAKLYDQTTLFSLNSSTTNGRYSYFSMDAAFGGDTNQIWLFGGTGNFERINNTFDETPNMDNILFGIKDKDYPYFKFTNNKEIPKQNIAGWRNLAKENFLSANNIDDEDICKNTTDDTTGGDCPASSDQGWVIHLDNLTENKYKKVSGSPTVYQGNVFYPVYMPPDQGNKCTLGKGYICSADDECGTNNSPELGESASADDDCYFIRHGIVSTLVVFGGKLYGNVAGPEKNEDTLVQILGTGEDTTGYRKSWRQNF